MKDEIPITRNAFPFDLPTTPQVSSRPGKTGLRVYQALGDRKLDQGGRGVQIKLFHDAGLVKLDGLDRHIPERGAFFVDGMARLATELSNSPVP